VPRRLAVIHDRLGDHYHALAEYELALKAKPKDPNLLNDVGYFHYGRGNWADAEKYLRQALALDPHHQRAWINLGMTLGQQQRNSESLEAFGHVVGRAEALCNLGFILTTQGKRKEAEQAYRDALALAPDLPLARAALAKFNNTEQKAATRSDSDRSGATASKPKPKPDSLREFSSPGQPSDEELAARLKSKHPAPARMVAQQKTPLPDQSPIQVPALSTSESATSGEPLVPSSAPLFPDEVGELAR
jgi:tetratricopeptide (TPR) repeat protein